MRQLAANGTSIIFITHKLREVQAVADRIVVIRLGKVVGEAKPTSSASELASMMVGREVHLSVDRAPLKKGDVVLSVDQISVRDDRGQLAVNNLSLELHAGEVLAIAGVQGNGQTELAEAIVGLRKLEKGSGKIVYKGKSVESLSVRERLEDFLSYVPEDRKKDGLVSEFNIEENLMLNQSFEDDRGAKYVRRGLLDQAVLKSEADLAIERFDIRTQGSKSLAGKLSGGNQQKVVLAREMSRPHDVLLVAQPTRGVDVGSIEFIHDQIMKERDEQSTAVLLISTELDEVLALADRIAVMYRGKIVGIVPADTSRETLGKMMAGVTA
jgi:simple sugar transport system ATP-binding protein